MVLKPFFCVVYNGPKWQCFIVLIIIGRQNCIRVGSSHNAFVRCKFNPWCYSFSKNLICPKCSPKGTITCWSSAIGRTFFSHSIVLYCQVITEFYKYKNFSLSCLLFSKAWKSCTGNMQNTSKRWLLLDHVLTAITHCVLQELPEFE